MEQFEYRDYRKKSDIHGVSLYPAVMVAPMQRDVLEKLIPVGESVKIIDPFHGSGTALYEAAELSDKAIIYGSDINPLANLITKSKMLGVDSSINQNLHQVAADIFYRDFILHTFDNISKWFREDIIIDLSKIKSAISRVESHKNRMYLWCVFSDIVRRFSNTRTDTYKLYSKNVEKIHLMKNTVIDDFLRKANENREVYKGVKNEVYLSKIDINKYLEGVEDRFFDICITSPPYGDNPTTVPYGQFSSLPLMWIDPKDLELEGWELENYSIIDSRSLGGFKKSSFEISEEDCMLIKETLSKISVQKQHKVLSFFADYFKSLENITRVTNKHIIMTLGNRTVDRININLTEITSSYLETKGFVNIDTFSRDILRKRMPSRTSMVDNRSVSSINKEFMIIYERNE